MRRRILKIFIYLCLLFAIALVVLVFSAKSFVEKSVNELVSDRDGAVEIGSIRVSAESGLLFMVTSYREPNVHVENLQLAIPFVSLFELRESISIRAAAESVTLDLTAGFTAQNLKKAERFNTIGETITDLCQELLNTAQRVQFQTVECEITDLIVKMGSFDYTSEFFVNCDASDEGDWITDIRSESEHFGLQVQICIGKTTEELAVDFSMGARQWDTLFNKDLGLSVEPFESGSFAEASGYFRWAASDADRFNFAILGNVAPWLYGINNSRVLTQTSSFGIATNGASVFRAYWNAPLKEIFFGSERYQSGEIIVEIDNHRLATTIEAGAHRLGITSLGYQSFFEGFGQLTASCKLRGAQSNQLCSFSSDTRESDLTFIVDAESSATIEVENYEMTSCRGSISWKLGEVQFEDGHVVEEGLSGVTGVSYEHGSGAQINTEFVGNALVEDSLKDEVDTKINDFVRSLVVGLKDLRIQK